MTNKKIWLGMLALALIFGMTVVGCGGDDGGGGNPQTKQYQGSDASGNTYILVITVGSSGAAPKVGDSYTLTIKQTGQADKVSTGTVTDINADGTFTLQPSATGSGTFEVTTSGTGINSVTGTIAVEGGGTVTPDTFNTIYLRAQRWAIEDFGERGSESGENWSSGKRIKLSDFYTGKLKYGDKIRVSGTVDKELGRFSFSLQHFNSDGTLVAHLGDSSSHKITAGTFDQIFTMQSMSDYSITNGEITVELANTMNYTNLSHPEWSYGDSKIPENIPDGTIMATIRNFSFSVVGNDDPPGNGGGNTDAKIIKITNITKTGEASVHIADKASENDVSLASGTGTITNNELTVSLTYYRTATPWTGNGPYLMMVEVTEMKGGYLENVQYFYTNGQTAQQLGITTRDNEETAFRKLPTYTITSQTSTIPFNLFRDINADLGY